MGVCGSGKSTIGAALSAELGAKFIDGDDLHPRENIEKMTAGRPLTDRDREPWLERIRGLCFSVAAGNETAVVACSAHKLKYRDIIRAGNRQVFFLYLHGSYTVIAKRLKARKGHFMGESMLHSQFKILEAPLPSEPGVARIDISGTFDEVLSAAIGATAELV